MSFRGILYSIFCALTFSGWPQAIQAANYLTQIGTASIDITPDYPIRLNGYGSRRKESEGVAQHLHASAIAIGSDAESPALLVTVDNCGLPLALREEIGRRLFKRSIRNDRINLCATHTHAAPCLTGFIPNIFSSPIASEEQKTIDRYTTELTDKIEQVCLQALDRREAGTLRFGQGTVGFAQNRRTQGGPVDHTLTVLTAVGSDEKIRAVFISYACHCTTLGGEFNQVHADWAGVARETIEREFPGAIALTSIGCGADANPQPRGTIELVNAHGHELAAEVKRLIGQLRLIEPKISSSRKEIDLPFDTLPTRAQWEERAKQSGIVGYHARVNLDRLDRGETLPKSIPYPIQTLSFGTNLAMVFLPGEVVVDYDLALQKGFDRERLCVVGYANYVPCYIPSRRILQEGGYEAEDSLWYYDRPARLAPVIEDLILGTTRELIPAPFKIDPKRAEFPQPKTAEESLATIEVEPGFHVELAAAEPLIASPVAIDWGADGKLWVVEMRDFPMGMDGKWKPGGRVKFLEDTNHDGRYDRSTIFLEDVPFPTGITAWREGVLICAAPDILYAVDSDGDGKADKVTKLFSGFATENYQARVNSLSLGLDNWIYGANGLIGGVIKGLNSSQEVNISGRDFRFNPETSVFEPAAGLTQQGRVRDDWGNWFGCDNSTLLWHYPIAEQYTRRNPYAPGVDPKASVASGNDPNRLFPASHTLKRFNDIASANRVTSVCGLGIYRDDALGSGFYGNAFLCEPVHNLVRRLVLSPEGVSFTGQREPKTEREFLAARDNWFRPVQVRCGPDGALWVVDMYRFVVEHPRWITPERLAELDVRAGADKGRIYRVVRDQQTTRAIRDLTQSNAADLVQSLNSSNGTERDRIQLELLRRSDSSIATNLSSLFSTATNPAVRAQILSVADGLHRLDANLVLRGLQDSAPGVLIQAIRLTEQPQLQTAPVRDALPALIRNKDATVRLQLTLSLGEWEPEWAGRQLGQIVLEGQTDPWLNAAVLSSALKCAVYLLNEITKSSANFPGKSELVKHLVTTALKSPAGSNPESLLAAIVPSEAIKAPVEAWRLEALASFLDAFGSSARLPTADSQKISNLFQIAETQANNPALPNAERSGALQLVGRNPDHGSAARFLFAFLEHDPASELDDVVMQTLARIPSPTIPAHILTRWISYSPNLRRRFVPLLLGREEWASGLLGAVEGGQVASAEISTANRQRFLKYPSSPIQARASKLFSMTSTNRSAKVAQYQEAGHLPGNTANGATIFGKLCGSCHYFKGQGRNVGPNLAALTDKSASFLLTSILDPNAAVDDRFLNYTVETRDGRVISGIFSSETASSVTVVNASETRETILRSDIQSLEASNLSLMPEGLEDAINLQEMADLIAYLQTSPAPFGSATPDQAARARSEFLKKGGTDYNILNASEALPYPSWLGQLPLKHCRQTDGTSNIRWTQRIGMQEEETIRFHWPVGMGLISQAAGHFTLFIDNRVSLEFNVELNDQSWENLDRRIRLTYTAMQNNGEDSNGILTLEMPKPNNRQELIEFKVVGSKADSQRWFGLYDLSR